MRRFIILLLIFCAVGVAAAYALPGSANDPLISKSYIYDTFLPGIRNYSEQKSEQTFGAAYNAGLTRLDLLNKNVTGNTAAAVAARKIYDTVTVNSFAKVRLFEGDVAVGKLGSSFVLSEGAANVYSKDAGELIDVSGGAAVTSGRGIRLSSRYISAGDNCGISSESDYTIAYVSGQVEITRKYKAIYGAEAKALKTLGLFRGTNSGLELERPATRIEALVMLIRLLGEENSALISNCENPFNDVPQWAERYAAYAYDKGYTKGTSDGVFTPSACVTIEQYLTFLLRALNYSDSAGDFIWSDAVPFALDLGLANQSEIAYAAENGFKRDTVVRLSKNALYMNINKTKTKLVDKLISDGAVSSYALDQAGHILNAG